MVTGGGTGIGKLLGCVRRSKMEPSADIQLLSFAGLMATQALAANGAKVYIVGRRKEALDNVVKHYSDVEGKIIP